MAGGAEGSIECRTVGSELSHPETLSPNPVLRPKSFRIIPPAQRQDIKGKLVDLPLCQSQLGHGGTLHHRRGRTEMLFEPIRECPFALHLGETELSRISVSNRGQIRAVIAADTPHFVAPAASQRMKEGFGFR